MQVCAALHVLKRACPLSIGLPSFPFDFGDAIFVPMYVDMWKVHGGEEAQCEANVGEAGEAGEAGKLSKVRV
jgi:hypothetical protein